MKKILGLDIGVSSIGWAIVEASDEKRVNKITDEPPKTDINNKRIGIHKDAVGVRIIPQDSKNVKSFNEGKKLNTGKTMTPAAKRRQKRGSRRMNNRYKMRRDKLIKVLDYLKMLPEGAVFKTKDDSGEWKDIRQNSELYTNTKGERVDNNDIGHTLYALRDKAIRNEITLTEWGRVILHLNQLRGYSSDRFKKDEGENFDYFSGTVIRVSEKPLIIKYDDESESEELILEKRDNIRWEKYNVEIKLDESIKETDEEGNEKITTVITGNVYTKKKERFLNGSSITFRYKEHKKETKIDYVEPKPDDWKARYKLLNQTLQEWCTNGGTPGSYFYTHFYDEKYFEEHPDERLDRIRNNVVNRDWLEQEFDKIYDIQFEKHRGHFENIKIEEVASVAFKDARILEEIKKKNGIKEQLRYLLKDKIIYYQRPWQQGKNKGRCRFENIPDVKPDLNFTDKYISTGDFVGRTVIPRSHPLHQEYKVWQQINNVRIWYHTKEEKPVELMSNAELCFEQLKKYPGEIKELLYKKLQQKKELSWRTFANDIFGVNIKIGEDEKKKPTMEEAYYSVNFIKRAKNGKEQDNKLKGNTTKIAINNILKNKDDEWLNFIAKQGKDNHKKEILKEKKHIPQEYQISNLQLLWELIYDITIANRDKVKENIIKHFPELSDYAEELSKLQFDDTGMASLCAKAIRNLLPLMSNGMNMTEKAKTKIQSLIDLNNSDEEKSKPTDEKLECIRNFVTDKNGRKKLSQFKNRNDFKYLSYWEAAAVVYGSHSAKKVNRVEKLERVSRHSTNNPLVEKIVNEALMLVNELKERYGFEEVRIELARELKASREEREQMWDAIQNNTEKIQLAKAMLRELKKGDAENVLNTDASNKSNLEKIKIIEDVVAKLKGKEHEDKLKEYKINEPTKAELKKYLHYLEQNFKCPYTNQPISLNDVFSKYKKVEIEHILPKERYYDDSYGNKVITWTEVNSLKKELGNRTAYEFIVSKRGQDGIKLANGKTVKLVAKENWESHIKSMFPKGKKRRYLLLKEIPEDPIERQLKETQYINKKLKEELERLCPDRVWTTTGSVTDILRERWHLNEVMKDLMRERFKNFKVSVSKSKTETYSLILPKKVDKETGEVFPEKFEGYSKRLDHRHHALDAIIVACTKQFHIQYLNLLNQLNSADQVNEADKKHKYNWLKEEICEGDSSYKFHTPWGKNEFITQVKSVLENVIVSHKNVRLLISPSKHRNGKVAIEQKVASLRGELHNETIYAKKNYYQGQRVEIKNIIKELLKRKYENQNQVMVEKRSFANLIKEYVFKEKYQKELIPIFERYDEVSLNNRTTKLADENSIAKLQKIVLDEIQEKNLLFNKEENKPLEWLTTFSEKNASARPMGSEMDLNKEKEIENMADPRIKRLCKYRLEYVNHELEKLDKQNLDKKEKDEKKSKIKATKIFSNAIYEARTQKGEWVELRKVTPQLFDKIEYPQSKRTIKIKEKLSQVWKERNNSFGDYLANPIFISKPPIPIKKVRQLAWVSNLYEIKPKQYVNASDTFMAYIFEPKKDAQSENGKDSKREIRILKFLEAINIIYLTKPNKIKYSELIPSPDKNRHKLAFTLAKNDLVYLPDKELSEEELDAIDWDDYKKISKRLYIVKDINPSMPQEYFKFQKHTQADEIKISESDAKSIFRNPKLEEQSETEKFGSAFYRDNCIKVFTDKLGKKIIPYWKFPNGCWDKATAIQLGLLKE